MRVIGYVRVSTKQQAAEADSPEAQKKCIRDWAALKGLPLQEEDVFSDNGFSGGRADNRRGLQAALALACESKGAIVVYSLARLARSTRDCLDIGQRLKDAGANLVSVTEDINTTSAMGKFFFRLLAILAELERDQTSERNSSIVQYKRSINERIGQIPYGKRLLGDGKTLVDDVRELQAIRAARMWRAEGKSLRQIAKMLMSKGCLTKKGNGHWRASSVVQLLKAKLPDESTSTAQDKARASGRV